MGERESGWVCSMPNTALFITLLKSKIPSHKPQAAASWKQVALGTYCELNPLAPGAGMSSALLGSAAEVTVQGWFLQQGGKRSANLLCGEPLGPAEPSGAQVYQQGKKRPVPLERQPEGAQRGALLLFAVSWVAVGAEAFSRLLGCVLA